MINIQLYSSEFNNAMDEILRLTKRDGRFVVLKTVQGVLINLVRFTPLFRRIRKMLWRHLNWFIIKHVKGRARLGWWPAWKAMKMSGAPHIGNGPLKDRGEGGVIDESRRFDAPSVTVFNEVPYIETIANKNNTVQRALARQTQFMLRSINRTYSRILRGRSG